jgi:hypothetical protein
MSISKSLLQEVMDMDITEKKNMLKRISHLEELFFYQQRINSLQASEIMKLKKNVEELQKQTENTQDVVYQLIPSLFNYETQQCAFESHLDKLCGRHDVPDQYYKSLPGSGNTYATTRQGDMNESRIEKLEKIIEEMQKEKEEND